MTADVEDRIRAQLEAQARTAPPAPALAEVVARCEGDLVRHRRRVGVTAAGVVATAIVVAVALPGLVGGSPRGADVADDARPLSDAQLIEVCRAGSQPAAWTDLVFGAGTPRVAARSDPGADYSTTILVSADGAYWADCFNAENAYANTPGALSDEPGRSSMQVFANQPSPQLATYSAGGTCARAELQGCDGFRVDYADRLPAAVGAVEFTTADGVTTRVDVSVDGFVVFDHEGVIPPAVRDQPTRVSWIERIVYLAPDGTPVAANRFDARHLDDTVDGLPPLIDYPSLRLSVNEATSPDGEG